MLIDGRKKWKPFLKKENMIVVFLLGLLLLVIAVPTEKKDADSNQESVLLDSTESMIEKNGQEIQKEQTMEGRLEEFLSCMEGAGEVKVLIQYSASEEKIVEKDRTAAGWQSAAQQEEIPYTQETVIMTDSQGSKTPYVVKTLAAQVSGVTVLAQGGDKPLIQKQITEMIEALFGLEPHKIRVAKMK